MEKEKFFAHLAPESDDWIRFQNVVAIVDELKRRRVPTEDAVWTTLTKNERMLFAMGAALFHIPDRGIGALLDQFQRSSIAIVLAARDGFTATGAKEYASALGDVLLAANEYLGPSTLDLSQEFLANERKRYEEAAAHVLTSDFFKLFKSRFKSCDQRFEAAEKELPALILSWVRANEAEFLNSIVGRDGK